MTGTLIAILLAHEFLDGDPDEIAEQTRFYRLNALMKLVGALIFAVTVALLSNRALLYLAAGFGFSFLLLSGLPSLILLRRLGPVLAVAIVASLSVGFFRGIEAFEILFLRIVAATSLLLAMVLSTPSLKMAQALRRLGMPKVMSNVLLLTYRYIFVFEDESNRMKHARQARGFAARGNLFSREILRTISYTAGMILIRAHRRSRALYHAMLSRHYSGELPLEEERRVTAWDVILLATVLVVSTGLFAATLGLVP
jgi:cobalt/nickel transport system permease protein